MQTLAPERLTSLKRVATIESIGSSTRIEGAKLTDRQVEKLLSGMKSKSFASRDESGSGGLCRRDGHDLRELRVHYTYGKSHQAANGVLLKYSKKDQDHRSHYKEVPNHVESPVVSRESAWRRGPQS